MIQFILFPLILLGLSFFSYLFIDPSLIYLKNFYTGFIFKNRELTTLIYILLTVSLFTVYFQFMKRIDLSKFKTLIGITLLILIFSYPAFLSFDIFNYTATAKTLFFYGENPYLIMPIEFGGDPLLLFTHAANKIALYGPIWITMSGIPYFAGIGNFIVILFSFKAFIAIFYLATVFILWELTKDIKKTALFTFNPLVLIEALMSSHNDIVMMFFALLSFYVFSKNKILLAIALMILSIFIKYATFFLIPVFIYALLKKIKKEKINWEKIYFVSFFSMFLIFLLSPLREEIYPWYAIWFLPFAILSKNKLCLYISLAFSFGLLFRYVPFMLWGTHFGTTPFIKTLVTFIPPILVLLYSFRKKLWLKTF